MTCRHWWLIDSPNGNPTVPGTCKLCGAERDDFLTSMPHLPNFEALQGAVLDRGISEDIGAMRRIAQAIIDGRRVGI